MHNIKKYFLILSIFFVFHAAAYPSNGYIKTEVFEGIVYSSQITFFQDISFYERYKINVIIKSILLIIILFLSYFAIVVRKKKKQNEKKLISSEKDFYNLINALPDAMVIHNADGKIKMINHKVTELSGYTLKELKDFPPEDLFIGGSLQIYYDTLNLVLKNKKAIHSGKLDFYHKAGRIITIDFNSTPSFNSENEVDGIYTIIRDVTEIIQDQKEIQNQNKELAFFYQISLLVLQSQSEEIFDKIVELISKYYSFPICFMLLYDSLAENSKVLAATETSGLAKNSVKSIKECIACNVLKTGEAQFIEDLTEQSINQCSELLKNDIHSILIAPIKKDNSVLGALIIGDKKKMKIDANQIDSLSIAANIIALLFENISSQNDRNRFFEMSLDMMSISYPTGYFKEINSAWTKTLGWSREELLLKPWTELIHPDDIPETAKAVERLANNKPVLFFENRYIAKTGEYHVLSWNSFMNRDDGLIFSVARDLTAVKLAQNAFDEAKARFKSLFLSMNEGVALHTVIFDEKGLAVNYMITDVNPVYEKILNLNKQDVINRPATEVYKTDTPPYFESYLKVLKGLPCSFETYFQPLDKYFIISAVSIAEDKFATIFSDITTNKKNEIERENLIVEIRESYEKEQSTREELESVLEEANASYVQMELAQKELLQSKKELEIAFGKAEDANRLKTEFLAIISHELRTPLTSMLGFSQLLTKEITVNQEHKSFAQHIYNSGLRLLDVVNDILEISVMEAGKIKIEYDFFEINKVIEGVITLFKEKLESKKLLFTIEVQGITTIYSDASRIRQILFNLIGNAIKFTESGEIKLKISQKEQSYLFVVSDTGIGIDKNQFTSIFGLFTQVEDHLKRKYQGTGLGLAICKRLVEALNGKIWVKSKKGKGSSFCFEIPMPSPIVCQDDSHKETFFDNKKSSRLSNITIIFAEDDQINHVLILYLLKQIGFRTIKGCMNGMEFIQEYQNHPDYDVILLDIQMPELNGIECLAMLREMECKKPVIALTAFSSLEDMTKLLETGFTDFIPKPIDPITLEEIIFKHVSQA